MRKSSSFWKWGRYFAVAGVSVATVFFVVGKLLGAAYPYSAFRVSEFLWPSSIFLLATDGTESTLGSSLIVVMAVLVNGAMYFLAGLLLWPFRFLLTKANRD